MRPRFFADYDFNRKLPLIWGRILVSHDRKTMPGHFARFRETQASSGVIIASQSLDVGSAIEDLLLIWLDTDAAEWVDHLGFVPIQS